MANSPAPLETIACFHCARQLQATKLSNRFSVCLKCKSCGGYSEASIRNGSLDVGVFAPVDMLNDQGAVRVLEELQSLLLGIGEGRINEKRAGRNE